MRTPMIVHAPRGIASPDLGRLLEHERDEITARLLAFGALLFRGFPIHSAEDLGAVQKKLGDSMRYIGGDSPRTRLTNKADVYTSTEAMKSIRLPLHNELSYLDVQPRLLWFACLTPAARGGATTIADGRAIARSMDPAIRDRFDRDGVRYTLGYRGPGEPLETLDRWVKIAKSWMDAFETTDRDEVEQHCREMNATFEWQRGGHLAIATNRPATKRHPVTGEVAWFNQAHLFHFNTRYLGRVRYELARAFFNATGLVPHDACFGDGSPLGDDIIDHVFDVLEAHTIPIMWEPGDVLLVDNVLCMHGRESFHGNRKIAVAMSA
jgi:alpha-ketoglutarate-dependent taurine dioxygenase